MGHMYSESLEGKVAIVTGADRGIGRAVAEGYAAAGAHMVVSSRTETDIQLVASEIESDGGKALPILRNMNLFKRWWMKLLAYWVDWTFCLSTRAETLSGIRRLRKWTQGIGMTVLS